MVCCIKYGLHYTQLTLGITVQSLALSNAVVSLTTGVGLSWIAIITYRTVY